MKGGGGGGVTWPPRKNALLGLRIIINITNLAFLLVKLYSFQANIQVTVITGEAVKND